LKNTEDLLNASLYRTAFDIPLTPTKYNRTAEKINTTALPFSIQVMALQEYTTDIKQLGKV
jgi:hypothetical protein